MYKIYSAGFILTQNQSHINHQNKLQEMVFMDVSGKILGSFTVSQQLTCAAPHETDDVFVLALLFTDSVKKFRGNSQEVPDAFSHIRTSLGH